MPVKRAQKLLTVRELAESLGRGQAQVRRAVDIVTRGKCARAGGTRAIAPGLAGRVRRFLEEEVAAKNGAK